MTQGRLLSNWLESYLAFTYEQESPEEYHLWVGLSTIAGALRRRCFFNMSYFLLYPNTYVVLVGPAGRCKKSTAMRIGREFLTPNPAINLSVDSTTRERMIQDLSQAFVDGQSSMMAFSSEFASLLTSSGMDMVVFLTDIYDSPTEWTHKTKVGGTNKIKAPCLTLLGATTPDWIAKAMPLDTIGVGLTSRIVFVFQDTPRVREPFPKLSVEQMQLKEYLLRDLTTISNSVSGEFRLSPEALETYTIWYKGRAVQPNTTGDPRLSGYFERKPMHVLKVAMAVSASKKDQLILTDEDIQSSFALLEQIEQRMPKVFANVGKNPLAVDIEDALAAVLMNPDGVLFGVLLDKFKHSVRKEEMSEVLDTLVSIGKIILVQTPEGPLYKPRLR